jgi:uncharacterized protein
MHMCAACGAPALSVSEFVCEGCLYANYCCAAHRAAHRAGKHARECETLGAAVLASVQKRAEEGEALAMLAFGSAYCQGHLRLAKDDAPAASWFKRAADLGDSEAHYNLGCAYRDGTGVEQDLAEALRRFRQAAEQGHDEAQSEIGEAYYLGRGVPVNSERAVHYFRLAAKGGSASAMASLGDCYRNGKGVPRSLPTARAWLLSARRLGADAARVDEILAAVGAGEAADICVAVSASADASATKRVSPDWPPYEMSSCVVCNAPAPKAELECPDCKCAAYCSAEHRAEHLATGGHADECEALCAERLVRWRKAAEGGGANAMANLGSAYGFGYCRLAKDDASAAS